MCSHGPSTLGRHAGARGRGSAGSQQIGGGTAVTRIASAAGQGFRVCLLALVLWSSSWDQQGSGTAGRIGSCHWGAMAEDPKSNVSLLDLANSFWTPTGLKLPGRELVEAVRKAKLPCVDAFGARRDVVIMTIASEFAFQSMFGVFLDSLANITFPRKDGSTDNLARHVVTNIMSPNSIASCRNVSDKYGAFCVNFGNPSFSSGNFWVHSNEFYGIGFTKTATILDGLTLNVDVLFLDADQVRRALRRRLGLHACFQPG
jgi:hypothetical protein